MIILVCRFHLYMGGNCTSFLLAYLMTLFSVTTASKQTFIIFVWLHCRTTKESATRPLFIDLLAKDEYGMICMGRM